MLQEIIIVKENMKFALLLFLLWSLVEVHSQTAPYLTFMGETLPDHSYVDLSELGEFANESDHVVCHTDLDTCCGGDDNPDRGRWYFPFPNGTKELPLVEEDGIASTNNPIVERRRPTQTVSLIRGTGPGDAPSGIYHCRIETNAVNTPGYAYRIEETESLYVGVYSTGGMCTVHGKVSDYMYTIWPYFSLILHYKLLYV